MSPRTAILGWGSLLWEGGSEFDRWHEDWQYDGPSLAIEFSRVSDSRLGALTLVIDSEHGSPTTVAWCLSTRGNPAEAVSDLRSREGTTPDNIGQARSGDLPTSDQMRTVILEWAEAKKLDAVVWTKLSSNFERRAGKPFSVETAIEYIAALRPPSKVKAAEYVWRAPEFVRTPLRDALERGPWFDPPGIARASLDPGLQKIVEFLNANRVRATYGAVGGALGVPGRAVGPMLGARRQELSWIVNGGSGEPTGYQPQEKHPALHEKAHVIDTGLELLRAIAGVQPRPAAQKKRGVRAR